jgi:hypothetical protein
MNFTDEFVNAIRIAIYSSPVVTDCHIVREDIKEAAAVFRYRLTLIDDGLLELTQRVEVQNAGLFSTMYRFHWQDKNGGIIARWDDAPHHPEIETFPYHIHEGSEGNVQPHGPVNGIDVLRLIEERLGRVL